MIKKIAWNTFKNTGDINAFLELKQIEDLERQIENPLGNMQISNIENIQNKLKEQE